MILLIKVWITVCVLASILFYLVFGAYLTLSYPMESWHYFTVFDGFMSVTLWVGPSFATLFTWLIGLLIELDRMKGIEWEFEKGVYFWRSKIKK